MLIPFQITMCAGLNQHYAAAGIGPYTGNAIASIAGNQRVAVNDANVVRVLARLRRLAGDQKSGTLVKLNAQLADSLVDPHRPGCFNQVPQACTAFCGGCMIVA